MPTPPQYVLLVNTIIIITRHPVPGAYTLYLHWSLFPRGMMSQPRHLKLWHFPVAFKDLESGTTVEAELRGEHEIWGGGREKVRSERVGMAALTTKIGPGTSRCTSCPDPGAPSLYPSYCRTGRTCITRCHSLRKSTQRLIMCRWAVVSCFRF